MGLKRSIVLIGSVVVLAACDSASAPTGPVSLHQGAAASAKRADTSRSTTNRSSTMAAGSCVFIRSGTGDSTQVCVEDPQIQ
jgi:hypothetical protein